MNKHVFGLLKTCKDPPIEGVDKVFFSLHKISLKYPRSKEVGVHLVIYNIFLNILDQ